MKRSSHHVQNPVARSGFSLIELLIVIVIIGILMALVLPAIQNARVKAIERGVSAEIGKLDQAITAFKNKYGVEPPSSLNIPSSASGWTAAYAQDRQKILRIWSDFDFTTLGGMGYSGSEVHLNGAECLTFFLGGVNSGTATTPVLIGFANNPRTPWNKDAANRTLPFYDGFKTDRLVDVDADNAVEFIDELPGQTIPYLYFSSMGKSYRTTNSATAWDDFDVHGGMNNTKDMSSIYLTADGKTPHRQGGYQIVSPGMDLAYGIGGVYKDEKGEELIGNRAPEADNITSFANGKLRQ